jgi:enoyl-CoA hydratase/carnithine racemase
LKELLDAESWLTAQQCLEYGLADEVLSAAADMTEAKQLLQKQNDNLVAKVNYNKSIAAQLREMVQKPEPKNPDPAPPAQLTNAEKLKQIFNKKTEVE